MEPIYTSPSTQEVADFFNSTKDVQGKDGSEAVLDSVKNSPTVKLPKALSKLFEDRNESGQRQILDAVQVGVTAYIDAHGVAPTADVIEAALSQGFNAQYVIDSRGSAGKKQVFDDATTLHHDQLSLHPNAPQIAIIQAISEVFPGAAALPADIGSNEARLIIATHEAGNTIGGYTAGSSLDGVNGGNPFVSADRLIQLSVNGGAGGTVTVEQALQSANVLLPLGSSGAVKLLRSRGEILVAGKVVAREAETAAGSGASPFAGTAVIASTSYAITGSVNPDTGAIIWASSPALPAATTVHALVVLDFEAQPALAAKVALRAVTYKLYASPHRGLGSVTPDANTQLINEARIDPATEALMALRNQFASERGYQALRLIALSGQGNAANYDFNFAGQTAQKTRNDMWKDFGAFLMARSQQMIEDTADHGITHGWVGKKVMANLASLPTDIWQPSGVTPRPGTYRLGKFMGLVDFYYSPKVVDEANNQMILMGRSTQVARNPILFGDAVPPTMIPLSTGTDFVANQGFYARSFTKLNPHPLSAAGCALVTITNLG